MKNKIFKKNFSGASSHRIKPTNRIFVDFLVRTRGANKCEQQFAV